MVKFFWWSKMRFVVDCLGADEGRVASKATFSRVRWAIIVRMKLRSCDWRPLAMDFQGVGRPLCSVADVVVTFPFIYVVVEGCYYVTIRNAGIGDVDVLVSSLQVCRIERHVVFKYDIPQLITALESS